MDQIPYWSEMCVSAWQKKSPITKISIMINQQGNTWIALQQHTLNFDYHCLKNSMSLGLVVNLSLVFSFYSLV